jgi:hypothetical protein
LEALTVLLLTFAFRTIARFTHLLARLILLLDLTQVVLAFGFPFHIFAADARAVVSTCPLRLQAVTIALQTLGLLAFATYHCLLVLGDLELKVFFHLNHLLRAGAVE